MRERNVDIVRRFVEAAERGDLEAVAGLLDPAVRWGGAGDDEGGCHNREEARSTPTTRPARTAPW